MHRATPIYILIIVASLVGLWLILKFGQRMEAPADFAGTWELVPLNDASAPPRRMVVQQSGLFFVIQIDEVPPLGLRVVEQQRDEAADPPLYVRLEDEPWAAQFEGPVNGETFFFRLIGPESGHWRATRVRRMYAGPVPPPGMSGEGVALP